MNILKIKLDFSSLLQSKVRSVGSILFSRRRGSSFNFVRRICFADASTSTHTSRTSFTMTFLHFVFETSFVWHIRTDKPEYLFFFIIYTFDLRRNNETIRKVFSICSFQIRVVQSHKSSARWKSSINCIRQCRAPCPIPFHNYPVCWATP